HQFNFVMIVFCQAGIADSATARHQHVRLLGEKQGRLSLVIAQFAHMAEIVAPHTPDTADGKAVRAARYADPGLAQGKNKSAHQPSSNCGNSKMTALTAAATIRPPASALACDGSDPMRPSGKRRR